MVATNLAINMIISLLEEIPRLRDKKTSVQARALSYKADMGHYYVMNVSLRVRIRLTSLQRVVCVEIWTTDLRQTEI